MVLLQAGEAICDQLIAVAGKVNGQGLGRYTAPDGWACEVPPVTPSGNVGTFSDGVGCTDGSVEISLFGSEDQIAQVDQRAAEPVEPQCPEGERYMSSPHLQECVVIEGAEEE